MRQQSIATNTTSKVSSLAKRVAQLPPEKRQLVQCMLGAKREEIAPQSNVVPRHGLSRAPLFFAQQRLWSLYLLMHESPSDGDQSEMSSFPQQYQRAARVNCALGLNHIMARQDQG